MYATVMRLLRKADISIAQPVASLLAVLQHTDERKRKVTFSIVTCKFESCGDHLFPVSASGYFVFRFPESLIHSVCQCVAACVFVSAV